MNILLSNDDGVYATGINILFEELKKFADVVIVAPDRERSASSHSLTIDRPLRVNEIKPDIFSVDGTPTDAVNIAVHSVLKSKPDLIISGINYGGNICDDVIYSGTVSAAMEGAIMGIKSIAVSLVVNKGGGYLPKDPSLEDNLELSFQKAAEFVSNLASAVHKHSLPEYTLLNVNIPQTIINKQNSFEYLVTRQGKRYFEDFVVEKIDPRGRKYYWIWGKNIRFEDVEGSDYEAVHNGLISVTPIHLDMTNYKAMEKLKNIDFLYNIKS
ncbi:MAG: 5'/3'-nucleotidase SurE [Deltaproteobacteria bacterium]|jgi:5'-nucleotidase|nr:5'/3'-nucleotidase SurE [Deltaproteobacteria bacterium]MCL5880170.1 5'/3'-nucleotidase SurE [Deltaproteobacteria bacterium]MDA8304780.1 5'/3'-nucleotidase SurE [Deltaproteobacteria bacterium]